MDGDTPPPDLARRVEALLHKRPVAWRRALGGYTPAQRYVVTLDDGTSCFVKSAVDTEHSPMATWLRAEYLVYSQIEASYIPRFLGWRDDGETPLLVLEDLSSAHWPPPWSDQQIDAIMTALHEMHRTNLHSGWRRTADIVPDLHAWTWGALHDNVDAFLKLGLCSRDWLEANLPALEEAARAVTFEGDDFVHFDIRSDNVCFVGDRAVFVDWNGASQGNGELDLAALAPSLYAEGGPLPEVTLPNAPHWASLVAGYLAARAGLPPIPNAPRVRNIQLAQLKTALPWAARALGLPPLDGPNAPPT
ncbi:MAG TPA: aminoglycoside phosphotransferase family protein [Dehalococcoidia bacterium]|nr:aminoglycoside phosphotransferase family protein [Dehalococcoidia bacterium]